MKKLIAAIILSVALAACQQTTTRTVPVINFQQVEIPSQFLDCKGKKIAIPNPKTLTNKQISQFILKLKGLLEECQNDISSIDTLITEYNLEVVKINERLNNVKNK